MELGDNSRFRRTERILVDGVETLGRWAAPSWLQQKLPAELVRTYVVPGHQEGRPDRIAETIYGADDLDWVLIAFNAPRNPFGWPRTGEVISYPAESVVIPEL